MTKIFNLIELIPHNKPTLGKEEEEAVLRVIRSNQLSQEKEVESFENEFCEFIGLPKEHAVAVSSGTAALYLSLWVLNSSGQRIAFPSYVCSAVRNAIGMVGGKEYFVDNKKDSPNLNFDTIKNESVGIAIIPHMFGIPSEIKNHNKLKIIEDCAQSLGAKINEKYVGTVGDVGIFSFYATKLMTTSGQGGMFVSKNKDSYRYSTVLVKSNHVFQFMDKGATIFDYIYIGVASLNLWKLDTAASSCCRDLTTNES